jgi:hypothetical protein
MFSSGAHGPESCGAAAIEACVELLKPTGGKIHAFLATLPNAGARPPPASGQGGLVCRRDAACACPLAAAMRH